ALAHGDEAAHDGDARRRRRRARGHGGVLHGAGRGTIAYARGPPPTVGSAMRPVHKRRLRLTAAFAAYFVTLWLLWETPVVYPLKVFVVDRKSTRLNSSH